MCLLSCDLNYTKFTETAAANLFPKLRRLQIYNTITELSAVTYNAQTPERFLKIFPQLRNFDLTGCEWGIHPKPDIYYDIMDEQDWF